MNLSCLQEAGDRLKLRVRKNQKVSSHLNSSNSKKLSRRYDPGKPFLSLAAVGDLPCNRFTSAHFLNLPWASDSEKWPNRRPVHRRWAGCRYASVYRPQSRGTRLGAGSEPSVLECSLKEIVFSDPQYHVDYKWNNMFYLK